MPEPILEDPYSLGKEDICERCEQIPTECPCGEPDPDAAYDRMMEERGDW